jgi:hypothetical protein
MQYPNINLNGTNGLSLAVQYHNAKETLNTACSIMGAIPHGRDYQGLPDGSYHTARDEMYDRIKIISRICDELELLELHCVENAR